MALIVENKMITFFKKAINRIVPVAVVLAVILGVCLWFWGELQPTKVEKNVEKLRTRIEVLEENKMIKVTIQKEDRLHAINKMASAIEQLSRALCVGTKVEISNNVVNGAEGETGIHIDTADDITETKILDTGE